MTVTESLVSTWNIWNSLLTYIWGYVEKGQQQLLESIDFLTGWWKDVFEIFGDKLIIWCGCVEVVNNYVHCDCHWVSGKHLLFSSLPGFPLCIIDESSHHDDADDEYKWFGDILTSCGGTSKDTVLRSTFVSSRGQIFVFKIFKNMNSKVRGC